MAKIIAKIKIKKEDRPKRRAGVKPGKIIKDKRKYNRKAKHKKKVTE